MPKLYSDDEIKVEGKPERVDWALYDALASRLLDLHAAINSGTENSVMAKINRQIDNGQTLDPQKIKDLIRDIDHEISAIHAQACLAVRESKSG